MRQRVSGYLLSSSSSLDFTGLLLASSPGADSNFGYDTPFRSRRDLNFRTGDPMCRSCFAQRRHGLVTLFDGDRASRMKHAAGRWIHRAWNLALENPVLALLL